MKSNFTTWLCGVVFAIGLGIGGMTMPSKVIGFLDIAGAWDASLAFVMGGALTVYAVLYRFARKRSAPMLAPAFAVPTRRDLDLPLVAGAALFGIGWAIGGFCPGPALVSLAWFDPRVILFVVAMCAGMLLHGAVAARPAAQAIKTETLVKADA